MRALLLALALVACSDPATPMEPGPDAAPAPDAFVCESYDRCEQYQAFPPACYQDECDGCGSRQCDNEQVCQEWEDTGATQCRTLFFCECR